MYNVKMTKWTRMTVTVTWIKNGDGDMYIWNGITSALVYIHKKGVGF